MAGVIPENLRSDKRVPALLRRVGSALTVGLDDDATVWFRPHIVGLANAPDFVVLDPSLGVVVLSVVDEDVLGVFGGRLRVADGTGERELDDPARRAQDAAAALTVMIAERPALTAVPVGAAVAFPDIDRSRAEAVGLDTVLDLDRALFKDDLDRVLRDPEGALLRRRLLTILEGGLGEALGPDAHTELRGVLRPDLVIAPSVKQGSLFGAESDTVKVMDRAQERLATSLGSGHRVVHGVAGSGKTLVLVHRARLLARLLPPPKRILVTCYTKALASQLRDQLAEFDNVDVRNLDALMMQVVGNTGDGKGRIDWDSLATRALAVLRSGHGERYRAVLVDEAQDFDTERLQVCVALLEGTEPDEQDLVVVGDSAQNIFRRNFSWKDAGIKAQGRTRILRVNYRNTREIVTFAHAVLTANESIPTDNLPDVDDQLTIIPAESVARSGQEPTVKVTNGVDAEIDAVVAQVRAWWSPRLAGRSIAVLMADHSGHKRGERIVAGLEAANVPVFWVTDPTHPDNKNHAGSADASVIVSTIHSAKGLEYPKVVVCGLGPSGSGESSHDALIAARKLLYVGFTRAADELAVVTTTDNRFRIDLAATRDPSSPRSERGW